MLWVLTLYSRSSPTKLWKRIFDLRSQNFLTSEVTVQKDFCRLGPVQMAKRASEISKIDFLDQKINFSVYIGELILGVSEMETNNVSAYLCISDL